MAQDEDLDVLYKRSDDEQQRPRCWFQKRCCIERLYLVSLLLLASATVYYGFVMFHCPGQNLLLCLRGPAEPANQAYTPEQLHLSLGANDNEYYVTWATQKPADTYLIWYRMPLKKVQTVKGMRTDGHFDSEIPGKKYDKHSYRAKMEGLEMVPNAKYKYRVVSCYDDRDKHPGTICDILAKTDPRQLESKASQSSKLYEFESKPYDDPTRQLKLIFYGDLGLLNAQSVPRLADEITKGQDLIIHNGDFAYDLNSQNGEYGDKFMRLMEQIAAKIPYQTSVGNHEIAGNFSEYNHRFTMINRGAINHGDHNNFFYSFNAGPVHFVAISTEFYYFLQYSGIPSLLYQYNWLKEDLAHASSAEERAKRPWIVVFGHRPMYCSSGDGDDCSLDTNLLRKGLPFVGGFALEKLFYDFGVDVELYSHEHQYERFLPIYDGKVYNGTKEDAYKNPRAPVHLISGSAGCQEKLDPFKGKPAVGSVVRISDYGYTKIKASRCGIDFEQISDDQAGDTVDKFTLTKNQQNFPTTGPMILGCLTSDR